MALKLTQSPPLSDMCAPVQPLGKSLQTVALQWLKVANPAIQKQNTQLQSLIKEVKVWRPFSSNRHWNNLNQSSLDKVLYKWFTTMCSEGKPMTGPNDNWRQLVVLQ
jgi:hypothetical protein